MFEWDDDLQPGHRAMAVIVKLGVDEFEKVYPELCTRPSQNCLQCAIEGKLQCQYIIERGELQERRQDTDEPVDIVSSDW